MYMLCRLSATQRLIGVTSSQFHETSQIISLLKNPVLPLHVAFLGKLPKHHSQVVGYDGYAKALQ